MSTNSAQQLQLAQPLGGIIHFGAGSFVGVLLLDAQRFSAGFITSISKSITRILTTKLGERVMRPAFGSNLHLLRDRDFNSEYKTLATRWVFEAINQFETRVRFKRLQFKFDAALGKNTFHVELEPND